MHDLGYILAGYLATGGTLVVYRWSLARRTRRARRLVTTLGGRAPRSQRPA
jgi:hypothetical protein